MNKATATRCDNSLFSFGQFIQQIFLMVNMNVHFEALNHISNANVFIAKFQQSITNKQIDSNSGINFVISIDVRFRCHHSLIDGPERGKRCSNIL